MKSVKEILDLLWIRIVLVVIGYFIIGAIISKTYTYLAGGEHTMFILMTFISPLACAMIWFIGESFNLEKNDPETEDNIEPGEINPAWIYGIYFISPIILNGVYNVLKIVGWETSFLFDLRINILWIIPAIMFFFVETPEILKERRIAQASQQKTPPGLKPGRCPCD
jgi:hypothetical protein